MKKLIYVFIVFAISLFSCEKDDALLENNTGLNSNSSQSKSDTLEVDFDEIDWYFDGEECSDTNELNEYGDDLICVFNPNDPDNLYYFSNETNFENWAIDQTFGAELIDMNDCISFLEDYIIGNGVDDYFEENGEYPEAYQDILDSLYEVYHGDKAGLFSKLYNYKNYGGSKYYTFGFNNPKWKGFRNKAESVKVYFGNGAYCDKTWYRGKRKYVISYSSNGLFISNLGYFRNKLESNFVF